MTVDGSTTEVVEFGGSDETPRRRGLPAADLLARVLADRRLVPLVAGLAALAAVVSLIGEWRVVNLPTDDGSDGANFSGRVLEGVTQIGTIGVVYELAIVALAGLLTLVLFGAPAVRHTARLLGLAVAGSTLVLLVVATSALRDASGSFYFFVSNGRQTVELGRGLTFAFAAVLLSGGAFYLAGRFLAAVGPAPVERSAAPGPAMWGTDRGWRRRRSGHDETEQELAEVTPLDLTVEPASPFARPTNE